MFQFSSNIVLHTHAKSNIDIVKYMWVKGITEAFHF